MTAQLHYRRFFFFMNKFDLLVKRTSSVCVCVYENEEFDREIEND